MITYDEVMPLIVAACPSFAPDWAVHEAARETRGGEILPYIVAHDLARHLALLYLTGDTSEFPAVFAVIERVHCEGEAMAAELATVGILEDLQNKGLTELDPAVFEPWLGPESTRWWVELKRFWRREIPYLGWSFRGDSDTSTSNPDKNSP